MTQDQFQTILILATLAVAVFALIKRSHALEPITLNAAVEEIKEAVPVVMEVKEIAQLAVNSVEQARREGLITDNNVAFREAYSRAKKWIPDEWEVADEDLVAAINAAVLVASALSKQAGISSKAYGTTTGQSQP